MDDLVSIISESDDDDQSSSESSIASSPTGSIESIDEGKSNINEDKVIGSINSF